MENSDSNEDSSHSNPHYSNALVISLLFFFITGIHIKPKAQQSDSAKVEILYRQIIQKTKCTNDFTSAYLYGLLYPDNQYQYPSYSSSSYSFVTNYSAAPSNTAISYSKPDTVFITEQIVKVDTVFLYQEIPNQDEVKMAQLILQTIVEDGDLTTLIQEVVKDMSSSEISSFRKEMNDKVQEMKDVLKKEQAQRLVAELEAKRLRQKQALEAAKALKTENKAAFDTLSKEEKKELVKAKVALITDDVLEGAKMAGTVIAGVAGASLAVVGGIVVQGVIAIGKGIIAIGKGIANAAKAIWNWIDDHFYVRIDLSCAQQKKIKKHRQYFTKINQHKHVVYYTGNCPGW